MILQTFLVFLLKLKHQIGKISLTWTEESYRNYKSEYHSLKELFKITNKDNKEEIRTNYFIDDGILMRSWKERNSLPSAVNKFVVLKVLRNKILRLGHQSALSAHLGIHKNLRSNFQ